MNYPETRGDLILKTVNEEAVVPHALPQAEYRKEKSGRINQQSTGIEASASFKNLKASKMHNNRPNEILFDAKYSSDDEKNKSCNSNFNASNLKGAERRQNEIHSRIASPKISKVEIWGKEDVSDWLAELNLEQYCDTFMRNQINGEVLLELSLEDLDYMSIKALGHRKTILKEIEILRHVNDTMSSVVSKTSEKILNLPHSSSSSAVSKITSEASTPALNHWSHIEPLASNPAKPCVFNVNHVNLADSSVFSETLDEEAEHAAFQRAVMAWRNADKSPLSFSPSSSQVPRETTRYIKKFATTESIVTASLKNSGDSLVWHNPFSNCKNTKCVEEGIPMSNEIDLRCTTTVESSASLLHGELDEEMEQEEFKKAVAAWRNGNNAKKLQEVVEDVSIKLEEEFSQYALTLERQKEEAIEKLNEARVTVSHVDIEREDRRQILCAHAENIVMNPDVKSNDDNDKHNILLDEHEKVHDAFHENTNIYNDHIEIVDMQMVESVTDYENKLNLPSTDCMNYYVVEYDSENEVLKH